jgi:hypothetical protein
VIGGTADAAPQDNLDNRSDNSVKEVFDIDLKEGDSVTAAVVETVE